MQLRRRADACSSPASVLNSLGGGFSAGVSYYGVGVDGFRPSHAVGPALQRAIPHGWFRLELIKGLSDAAPDELRLTLQSGF